MAPFSRRISPKTPPSCLQDALERPSLAPKTAQEPPNRRPRCAKSRPRAAPEPSRKRPTGALGRRHATKQPQTPSRPRFLTILATIWKDFGTILDGFLERRNRQIDRTEQTDRQIDKIAGLLLFVLARWRGRSFAARWIHIVIKDWNLNKKINH